MNWNHKGLLKQGLLRAAIYSLKIKFCEETGMNQLELSTVSRFVLPKIKFLAQLKRGKCALALVARSGET